jgi:uncharacterized protein YbaR (Trm112 family)
MKTSFFQKLACPFDKSSLKLQVFARKEDEIMEGIMECPECNRYYPIVYGVPIMSPDEYREASLEAPLLKKWEKQLGGRHQEEAPFRLLPEGEKER